MYKHEPLVHRLGLTLVMYRSDACPPKLASSLCCQWSPDIEQEERQHWKAGDSFRPWGAVWLVCPWLCTALQEQVIPLEEGLGWSTRRQVVGPGRLWLHQALGFYSVLVFTHHHCFQHRAAEQDQCPHGITICTSPTPTCGVPFK